MSTHPGEQGVALNPTLEASTALQQPAGFTGYLSENLGVYLQGTQARVDGELETIIEQVDAPFSEFYRHVLGGSAKRLRPALVYMTGDTFGISRDRLDSYAAVTEMFHSDSLIVDDMQDGDDERRGRLAAHARFDWNLAITGSHMISFHANRLLAGIDATAGLDGGLSAYVNQALGDMCVGQALDLQVAGQDPSQVTTATLEKIAALKTGSALRMSIVGAARIGEVPGDQIYHLENYARHAGIAFQIRDDLLDTEVSDTDGSHYVAVAGNTEAQRRLRFHRTMATIALGHLTGDVNTVKFEELADYLVERDR